MGTSLGPYDIVAAIGAGGMGEVYRARDRRLDRDVAIKVLPAHLSASPDLRERFEREARAISQLNHAHICTLYDVGRDNGTSYLVMELISGESLADRLVKGPLPIPQVLQFGAQIASALAVAHRQGIVHRDLKPGNIMITRAGAKLLDFGLAKPAGVAAGAAGLTEAGPTQVKPLTAEGTIVGTFQYMAPEQLEGLEADTRTDIFALGAVLYEMATGRRAFDGKTRTSLIAAIVQSEPTPISEFHPMTPPALEHVVRKCLAKDPDDRWQSAHDISEELRWIGETVSSVGPAGAAAKRGKRSWLLWTAAVLGVLVAFLAGRSLRPREASPAYRFTIPGIGPGYSEIVSFRFSPDSRSIAFVARNDQGVAQLFIRRLDSLQVTPVAGTEGVGSWAWSPDGRSIVFSAAQKLRRTSIDGGGSQVISTTRGRGIASGDGVVLVGDMAGGIRKITVGTDAVERITKPDPVKKELGHIYPNFFPDLDRYTFTTYSSTAAHNAYVGSLSSGKTRFLGTFPSVLDHGGGYVFFVADGVAQARRFDMRKTEVVGEPVTVAENVAYHSIIGGTMFHAARNGTIAWSPFTAENRIAIVSLDGKRITSLGPEASMRQIRAGQDGQSLVVTTFNPRLGTTDIESFGVERPTQTRLTFDSSAEYSPVLSADGTRLYFASDKAGIPDIYEKPVDGTAPERPVVRLPGDERPVDISGDSKLLLYTSNNGGRSSLWIAPLTGGKPYLFAGTQGNENSGRFSPGAVAIAYSSDMTGRSEVYVRPLHTKALGLQVSTSGGSVPRWSADGSSILFIGGDGRSIMLAERRAQAFAEPRLLFRHDKRIDSFDILPGKRLAILEVDDVAASPPIHVAIQWTEHVGK